MRQALKWTLAAALAVGTLGGIAEQASAMPMSGLDPAIATQADTVQGVENVRWVCPPYRPCFWAPGYYGPRPFYGPRYGWRRPGYGYGWRRHW